MDGWLDEWDIFIPQMLVSCSHNPQSLGFHDSIARRLQGWGEGAIGPLQLHVAGRQAQGMMRGNQRGVLWRLPCLGRGERVVTFRNLDRTEHVHGCWGLEIAKACGHPPEFSGQHGNIHGTIQKQGGRVIKRTRVRILSILVCKKGMGIKTSAQE